VGCTVVKKKRKSDGVRPAEEDELRNESQEGIAPLADETAQDINAAGTEAAKEMELDSEALDTQEANLEASPSELERARAEGQEYLDGWQRARAEFANYKKRVERESQESHKRSAGVIFCRYLGIIDDMELALRERPTDGDAAEWAEGIGLIYQKLLSLLEAEGVERIQAEGEIFDPNFHEALSHEESSEHSESQVIEVIRQGYILGERVLRPALVRVAK